MANYGHVAMSGKHVLYYIAVYMADGQGFPLTIITCIQCT